MLFQMTVQVAGIGMLCFYAYMTDSAYRQIWVFDHARLPFLTQNTAILQLWRFTSQAIFRDSRCIPLKSLFVGLYLCFAALDLPVWLHFHSRLCTWVRAHVHALYRVTTI